MAFKEVFKVLLLETWYNLSDCTVEERINDSISLSKFIGIDLEQTSPDHSTLCRFRNSLVKHSFFDKLLEMLFGGIKDGSREDDVVIEGKRNAPNEAIT